MLNALPWAWMDRGHVIPAYAGIQIRGTAWIPACAGMTTTRRAPYIGTLEYITRSRGMPRTLSFPLCIPGRGAAVTRHNTL
jgi:hypothetical protein